MTNNIAAIIKLISKIQTQDINCLQQISYLAAIASISREIIYQKYLELEDKEKVFLGAEGEGDGRGTGFDEIIVGELRARAE